VQQLPRTAASAAEDLIRSVGQRKRSPDRARALSRADIEQLLAREDVSLTERRARVELPPGEAERDPARRR
jgi:hypothetical protein